MAHGAQASSSRSYHSELLCFAVIKLDTMPYDILVKTCANFYTPEKIQDAKDLLWETVMTVFHGDRAYLRNIKRKNTGASSKARADTEDIVKAL